MEREIKAGQKYKHFKGMVVEIIALAKDCETLDDLVVYTHDGDTWVREKKNFLSEVDHEKYPNVEQKYRFEEIYE